MRDFAVTVTLILMRRRATPLKMNVFALTVTLTGMRRRATPLIMKDISVTFTLMALRKGATPWLRHGLGHDVYGNPRAAPFRRPQPLGN